VLDVEYVRGYFDQHAADWVAGYDEHLDEFPLEWERVRIGLTEAVAGLRPDNDDLLVDLGCGGGELCCHAAELGYPAVGVDVAEGMIEEAERRRSTLPGPTAARVRFVLAPFGPSSGLADQSAGAVTALGLIEYTTTDDELFAEVARLLRPEGVAVVSCRNLLFSLASANEYTERVLDNGSARGLLEELRTELAKVSTGQLNAAISALAAMGEPEADAPRAPRFDHGRLYTEARRQHTPAQVAASAALHGLELDRTLSLHPHLFPPVLERAAPRSYNQVARALQPAVEASPLGLAICSTFIAVLRRR
jgi:SAM-dependent methyltransferase